MSLVQCQHHFLSPVSRHTLIIPHTIIIINIIIIIINNQCTASRLSWRLFCLSSKYTFRGWHWLITESVCTTSLHLVFVEQDNEWSWVRMTWDLCDQCLEWWPRYMTQTLIDQSPAVISRVWDIIAWTTTTELAPLIMITEKCCSSYDRFWHLSCQLQQVLANHHFCWLIMVLCHFRTGRYQGWIKSSVKLLDAKGAVSF